MITQTIIDLITNIATTILSWLASVTPEIDIMTYMLEFISKIMTITTQANNFIHFMLGDFVVVLLPGTIGLLIYKYAVYPIITFIRSFFVNGNN